jgi:hypothetical protein
MFIVIDIFNEPIIVVDPKTNMIKYFKSYNDAKTETNDHQDAIIASLNGIDECINLLSDTSAFIDTIKFEEGENIDENDLEFRINNFLSEYKN